MVNTSNAPKRGRPNVADDDRREVRILLRVSEQERDAIEAGAAAAGEKLSPWIRELCLAAAKRAVKASRK